MLKGWMSGVLAVVSVSVAMLSGAGTAAAAPAAGRVSEDAFPSPRFLVLNGDHGYRVFVEAYPRLHRRAAQVVVSASGHRSLIRYAAPADLAGEGIHASLGRFGAIDLRWVPDGRVANVRFACHGHERGHVFFDRGSYVGTLRFRGGDGFTAVRAHRVEWRSSWYHSHDACNREAGEGFPGPGAILEADTGGREPRSSFSLYQPKPGAQVFYSAFDREPVGRLTIERSVETRGAPTTLVHPRDLSAATVSPSAPFSGTASFVATEKLAEGKGADGTWLGDLAVDFPDGSQVSLAGAAFKANLRSGELEGAAIP